MEIEDDAERTARHLPPSGTVVDVGANCGDTLAAMWSENDALRFVCVEADDEFFGYLTRNIARIKEVQRSAHIQAIKALIGTATAKAQLAGSGGTKHAVIGAGDHSFQRLDDLVTGNVRLIKSDVDNFDHDVLDSARAVIEAQRPILLFECQYEQAAQKAGFERTVAWLSATGYSTWVVFDNFGEVMLETGDTASIYQLMDYVWRQNQNQNQNLTTRTTYYYDLLACTAGDSSFVRRVLADYLDTAAPMAEP